jgi:hypothetical protein
MHVNRVGQHIFDVWLARRGVVIAGHLAFAVTVVGTRRRAALPEMRIADPPLGRQCVTEFIPQRGRLIVGRML